MVNKKDILNSTCIKIRHTFMYKKADKNNKVQHIEYK